MNKRALALVSALFIMSLAACSKKDSPAPQNIDRSIQFVLFTEKDFSANSDSIVFSLVIKDHAKILFDSTLAPMEINEIPDLAHKLVFQKTLTNNDGAELGVGFLYTIKNVGNSWYLDTCSQGVKSKTVNFSFQ